MTVKIQISTIARKTSNWPKRSASCVILNLWLPRRNLPVCLTYLGSGGAWGSGMGGGLLCAVQAGWEGGDSETWNEGFTWVQAVTRTQARDSRFPVYFKPPRDVVRRRGTKIKLQSLDSNFILFQVWRHSDFMWSVYISLILQRKKD